MTTTDTTMNAEGICEPSQLSTLRFGFPTDSKKNLIFASFTIGDQVISKFHTDIILKYAPTESKFGGKQIYAIFDPSIREYFDVLIHRASAMTGYIANSIKNPINEKNGAYLKLGPKYEFHKDVNFETGEEMNIPESISFGLYEDKEKKTMGFFARLN